MGDVFFTADLHFGHKSIIKYTNRPVTDASFHLNYTEERADAPGV